jgi:hypothetical protein
MPVGVNISFGSILPVTAKNTTRPTKHTVMNGRIKLLAVSTLMPASLICPDHILGMLIPVAEVDEIITDADAPDPVFKRSLNHQIPLG